MSYGDLERMAQNIEKELRRSGRTRVVEFQSELTQLAAEIENQLSNRRRFEAQAGYLRAAARGETKRV